MRKANFVPKTGLAKAVAVSGLGMTLFLVMACGADGAVTPGNPAEPSKTRSTPTAVPPAGDPLPSAQLDAAALPDGYPRQVLIAEGGKKLVVIAQEGGCGKTSVEVASQAPQRVVITLVQTTPNDGRLCTMDLRLPKLTVALDEPLGQRIVELHSVNRTS